LVGGRLQHIRGGENTAKVRFTATDFQEKNAQARDVKVKDALSKPERAMTPPAQEGTKQVLSGKTKANPSLGIPSSDKGLDVKVSDWWGGNEILWDNEDQEGALRVDRRSMGGRLSLGRKDSENR